MTEGVACASVPDLVRIRDEAIQICAGMIEQLEKSAEEIDALRREFISKRVSDAMAGVAGCNGGSHLIASMQTSGEAAVVEMAAFRLQRGELEADGVPLSEHDKVVFEMQLQRNRADIVIFHMDGSITIIEAKDGAQGYRSVVGGIGQVGYYATMLGMQNTGMKARRALLWSTVGTAEEDDRIKQACEMSGVIPILCERPEAYHSRLCARIAKSISEEIKSRESAVYAGLDGEDRELLKRFGLLPEGV